MATAKEAARSGRKESFGALFEPYGSVDPGADTLTFTLTTYPEGMVKLNTAAGEILKRCDGERTVGEIISELEEQFSVPDLADDVLEFFIEAHGKGWITT